MKARIEGFTDAIRERCADVCAEYTAASTQQRPHEWEVSTLGHGEAVCKRCGGTNRELAVLGMLNHCDGD